MGYNGRFSSLLKTDRGLEGIYSLIRGAVDRWMLFKVRLHYKMFTTHKNSACQPVTDTCEYLCYSVRNLAARINPRRRYKQSSGG